MKQELEKIKEWNQVFGILQHDKPSIVHRDESMERFKLIYEELLKYKNAVQDEDLTPEERKSAILYALVEIQSLLLGAVRLYGYQDIFEEAFAEVHRSNLSKLENGFPLKREDGRILKGSWFFEPDLKQFFR